MKKQGNVDFVFRSWDATGVTMRIEDAQSSKPSVSDSIQEGNQIITSHDCHSQCWPALAGVSRTYRYPLDKSMESTQALQTTAAGPLVAGSSAPVTKIQQVHGVTINHGDLLLAGGDVNIHRNYYTYHTEALNAVSALRFVLNLRKVHLDVLSKATPGTVVWLFKTDYFLLWLDPDGDLKILWGTGIPGAGKSVMASIVIHELEARAAAAGGRICVCYVYVRYSDASDLTIRSILEILVKQTTERHPECASLAEEAYARHLQENTQPTEAELLQLLHKFTGTKSVTFYVLDAVDEAPDKLQLELVKKLASLNVRLFITSRPLKDVESRVPGVHGFPIAAQARDLELHINEGIERSPGLQGLLEKEDPSLKEEIVSSIKKNCNGMFLHASLQLDALCECLSPREVRRTLEAFPSDVEDVYLETWDRIMKRNPTRVSLAKTVLVWVLSAARSMTVDELERAVSTSPVTYKFELDNVMPGMSLVSLCRGLVTFEGESRVVRLVHYTAKRVLQRLLHDLFPHPHSHLAVVCMTHLTDCGFQNTEISSEEEFTTALQVDPLLAYASDAWANHARESLDAEDTRQQTASFVSQSNAFPAFTLPGCFDIVNALHILAIYNLKSLILHVNMDNPNAATRYFRESPLHLASCYGHEGVVEVLLAHPKIQVNLVNDKGWSALVIASLKGRTAVVQLLLARPEIQVNLVSNNGWSALMLAAGSGHKYAATLLLANPAIQVNMTDNKGLSALMMAAMMAATPGHEGIIKLLLACPEIQVNLVSNAGWSALMFAAGRGHEGAAKLLLARPEIQVNLADNQGWSALTLAVRYGHKGLVALLLAMEGININAATKLGITALNEAAALGYEPIVELLLGAAHNGITIDTDDVQTAMSLARIQGHGGIVQLLEEFEGSRRTGRSTWG